MAIGAVTDRYTITCGGQRCCMQKTALRSWNLRVCARAQLYISTLPHVGYAPFIAMCTEQTRARRHLDAIPDKRIDSFGHGRVA